MPDHPSPMYDMLLPAARKTKATVGMLAILSDEITALQAQRFAALEAQIADLTRRLEAAERRDLREALRPAPRLVA